MSMRSVPGLACLAAIVSLVAVAPAGGATVEGEHEVVEGYKGSTYRYTRIGFVAAPGEANRVTFEQDDVGLVIRDAGAELVPSGECSAVDPHTVRCARTYWSTYSTRFELGDRDDTLEAPAFVDGPHVLGGDGADTIRVEGSYAHLEGGADGDLLMGGGGDQRLAGGDGDDRLAAGHGRDGLRGGAGADVIRGDTGANRIEGGLGDDRLAGGDGDDEIEGGGHDDRTDGGAGDDRLEDRSGLNRVSGGAGDDHVALADAPAAPLSRVACGDGRDTLGFPPWGLLVPRDCERVDVDSAELSPVYTGSARFVSFDYLADKLQGGNDCGTISLGSPPGKLGRAAFRFRGRRPLRVRVPLNAKGRRVLARRKPVAVRVRLDLYTCGARGEYPDVVSEYRAAF
jgi:hypothetical protein